MSQCVEGHSRRPWLLARLSRRRQLTRRAVRARAAAIAHLQMYDFVEYWAAGRLIASGENPYDGERMHALEREAGRTEDGILMWNPPWTLPLVLPFGLLHVRGTISFGWPFSLRCSFLRGSTLGALRRRPRTCWLAWLLGLSFLPTLFALTAGQITPLLLLGASVSSLSWTQARQRWPASRRC